ncbi:MAG TPA: sigma-54-dependent Fis family transcriptional regulator [Alphaproteobacteria bacterium]|nr:sigma-54-dependent Fis family transcriptional regulator [Alphaproteobacteria bacterium]
MDARAPATGAVGQPPDDRLSALLYLSQRLNAERDLATLLDLMAREVARLLDAERASVFLLDRSSGELWSLVALGSEPLRFDARRGIAGSVVQTGATLNVADVQQDPRFYPAIDAQTGFRTRNLLAVPLRNHAGEITGAFQVLNKREGPFTSDDEELLKAVAAQAAIAIETAQLIGGLQQQRDALLVENTQLWQAVEGRYSHPPLLGTSPLIRQIVRLIEQLRDSSVEVLITGESGTGKELVARALHYTSRRARGPFVAVNCAALPASLVESELFGIERGVATGVERRIGKFEAAHGGTLFLDELGDLSAGAQATLLRVLQERVIERVGGRRTIPVDVRVVAATNKDLEAAIAQGTFRPDLFYRLKVIHIVMPPLRAMREDIRLLAAHFLEQFGKEQGKGRLELSPEALRCLETYDWPGNVRELAHEMKRLVVLAKGPTVEADDLSAEIRRASGNPISPVQSPTPGASLKVAVAELEQHMLKEAMIACGHNQVQAARRLGLSRQGLIKKLKRYGIAPRSGMP